MLLEEREKVLKTGIKGFRELMVTGENTASALGSGRLCVLATPALAGLVVIGLGCAPIYPCIIHSTPEHFGAENSQALIGVQMASAYVGTLAMPPLFGLIANHISIGLFPIFLLVVLAAMALMHERLVRKTRTKV